MIQALVFDFDGLILDTEMSAFQSWQEVYREYNCELPLEKWALCIGSGIEAFDAYEYLETQVGHALEREAVMDSRMQRHLRLIAMQPALPGVETYVTTAKKLGLKLAVASSSPRAWLEHHLQRLGLLSSFDGLSCGDEVTHKKPHPELYLHALTHLDIAAHQAIALEDSPNGVRAAQQAGLFCVAIPNPITGQLSLDHADLRLPSMAALSLHDLITEVENRSPNSQVI